MSKVSKYTSLEKSIFAFPPNSLTIKKSLFSLALELIQNVLLTFNDDQFPLEIFLPIDHISRQVASHLCNVIAKNFTNINIISKVACSKSLKSLLLVNYYSNYRDGCVTRNRYFVQSFQTIYDLKLESPKAGSNDDEFIVSIEISTLATNYFDRLFILISSLQVLYVD